MGSRERILESVKKNGASRLPYLEDHVTPIVNYKPEEKFRTMVSDIGGTICDIKDKTEIKALLSSNFPDAKTVLNACPDLDDIFEKHVFSDTPHTLHTLDIAVMEGRFGVAENGAIWVTNDNMGDRALPFICQHLCLVIHNAWIIPTLLEAYRIIDESEYEFGTFIAGPSKTADIEQSLVLGAHGPKTLTVFIIKPA